MGRLAFLVICGLGGAGILISLGIWQVQRLSWKQGVIAEIEARIAADPLPLPLMPESASHRYMPVQITGMFGSDYLRVLISQKGTGAGYRIISPFVTGDRRVMVDRGVLPVDLSPNTDPSQSVTVIGNLHWPRESDSYTPAPDLGDNIWFARDVAVMAEALGTDPVLIVQRVALDRDDPITPLPVNTADIPNDHLQYAITWFSLAAIWLIMTIAFLRRRATP